MKESGRHYPSTLYATKLFARFHLPSWRIIASRAYQPIPVQLSQGVIKRMRAKTISLVNYNETCELHLKFS